MFDSIYKENIKKTWKTITPIVDNKNLRVFQNIPLRGRKESAKNHTEVGKVVLLIQEIL